jgi:hypothetical protein
MERQRLSGGAGKLDGAVQHVLLTAASSGAPFRGRTDSSARAWCSSVLSNHVASELQRRSRETALGDLEMTSKAEGRPARRSTKPTSQFTSATCLLVRTSHHPGRPMGSVNRPELFAKFEMQRTISEIRADRPASFRSDHDAPIRAIAMRRNGCPRWAKPAPGRLEKTGWGPWEALLGASKRFARLLGALRKTRVVTMTRPGRAPDTAKECADPSGPMNSGDEERARFAQPGPLARSIVAIVFYPRDRRGRNRAGPAREGTRNGPNG